MLNTTITGSLPKPSWLAKPEALWAPWTTDDPALLEEAKYDAVRLAIRDQEEAGIDIVTDGEQSRQHFVHGILEKIDGIDFEKKTRIGIRGNRYDADCPTVVSGLNRSGPIHGEEVKFARTQTNRDLKFTMPGPMTIVDTLADQHYGDRPKMAMAFAEILNEEAKELVAAGVDTLQFDEPAFNVYLDAVPTWGVASLNRAVEGLDCTTAVHICYGYGIEENLQWKATLGDVWDQYAAILPALAGSNIDQVSLEFAGSRVPMEVIKLLDGKKDVLVGAIDVTTLTAESPEEVAVVIRNAMEHTSPERIFPCTNCGMVPLPRTVSQSKLRALVAGAALVRAEL
ncbi:MAG: 5-methyltetrahydropteroyltriglutamate--homocysteine methyltransferase [Alphaproteobacteria bacterium]|nr:5-methyltetrahydropteroyltriglutamate--homocysteine methyltransferase [Alphaproteobacteria bacterium]